MHAQGQRVDPQFRPGAQRPAEVGRPPHLRWMGDGAIFGVQRRAAQNDRLLRAIGAARVWLDDVRERRVLDQAEGR